MDIDLKDRLKKIKLQVDALHKAHEIYLSLDGAKEHTLAVLITEAPIELTSQSAKETWAKADKKWAIFKEALAIAEAEFYKQKHMLDLQNNTFQAQYLSVKIDYDLTKRDK